MSLSFINTIVFFLHIPYITICQEHFFGGMFWKLNFGENYKKITLSVTKMTTDVFGCDCQLILPVVCHRQEAGRGHTFPIIEMWTTCFKMLPSCLTHCKSSFHSLLLSWNSHAVLISYTSCHKTLPVWMKFYKIVFSVAFPWTITSKNYFQ